ncbi:MAG: EAL domain-containing protein [Acidimicrobiia bacterium]|nr:EAL domain-containing protein [Acidimicrobiia bacterium]
MTTRIRVLLVEDDDDDRLLTTDTLDEVVGTRYQVTWVRDATEAIAVLTGDGEPFDVALVDFHLGALTGLDILHAVRAAQVDTPCILLTGQSDAATDRAAMAAGAADFIVKSGFDADLLERSIRYAVERAATLRSLRESEIRFRSVVEAASEGIALLGDDGSIISSNRAMRELFGDPSTSLDGIDFQLLLAPASAAALLHQIENMQEADTIRIGPIEADGRRRDGAIFPIEVSVSSWRTDGGERLWSAIVRDVTERKALADQLQHQAFHDPLTGLANRALLRERVDHGLAGLARTRGYVGVLFLDLDNFKLVNDTFGHDVGDELLEAVAARLEGCVRPTDTVARLGGDEFAVCLLDVAEPNRMLWMADRIIRRIAQPFDLQGRMVDTTGSIGLAVSDDAELDADALLRNADVAMYAAKGRGKNRFEVFEDAMHGALVERVELEADLRQALDLGEIHVDYQPVFNLDSGMIRGFEALARWDHPKRGPVSPSVFISIAEESGLIRPLGRWILTEAVVQAAQWQRRFVLDEPISIAVNLSSRQLADPGLLETVDQVMTDSGLIPGSLILEITESVMMGDVDQAVGLLEKLRELGVQLALDDFGTGYSSLNYLHLLPLDIVKVDRAFVNRIDDEGGAALVRAIVAMGDSLGLDTVAEGVESEDQRDFLRREGYTYGQGYLFARPLSVVDAEEMLARLVEHGPLWIPSQSPLGP